MGFIDRLKDATGPRGRNIIIDLIRGATLGLIVLGVGGRLVMRVISHLEGRTPTLTPSGTLTVIFAGAVAGAFAGLIYWVIRLLVRQPLARALVFLAVCLAITWYVVHDLLPRPLALFLLLISVYAIAFDAIGRRRPADVGTSGVA